MVKTVSRTASYAYPLIQLEAEQKELLEQIIAGEQLTKDELAFHGVQWPAENKDRKPHFPGDLF